MSYRQKLLGGSSLVWTVENRPRYDRRSQRYPSDITNEEWVVLEPHLPVAKGVGRPRTHMLREVINGIRYVQRYGIPWDAMPKDLPPGSICYDYWRALTDGGHLDRINHLLVMQDREKAGREASPTLVIVDAQSIKCDAPQGERGFDAGKKVVGRKRHVAVDTDGRLLAVKVTSANVQDQDGGIALMKRLVRLYPCPLINQATRSCTTVWCGSWFAEPGRFGDASVDVGPDGCGVRATLRHGAAVPGCAGGRAQAGGPGVSELRQPARLPVWPQAGLHPLQPPLVGH